jgi:AraC-like DNA-binding protein
MKSRARACIEASAIAPGIAPRYGIAIYSLRVDGGARDDFATAPLRQFPYFVLGHIYRGQGRLWLEDSRECPLDAGDYVILRPGVWNLYGGVAGTGYAEDYVFFDGPLARQMADCGLIETGVVHYSPARRLTALHPLVQDPAAVSQWRASLLLQELLLDLQVAKSTAGQQSKIGVLLDEIQNSPEHWWTVDEMADYCGLSVSQFRRQFLQLTKQRPKNYIEEAKLREAARLLEESSLPIDDIFPRLGYRDRFHFCRRFKDFWGISPGKYRIQVALHDEPPAG